MVVAKSGMNIRRLDDVTVSRIAAGEVIERPASVVKELVENSLDAGATRIDVDIQDGGVKLLRVADDGCGIAPDEVAVAFERFATSKLTSDDDLWEVQTLGFRGEALPSIGSIASVEMLTRTPDGTGVRYQMEYGEGGPVEPVGVGFGTKVVVRDLFRKTPARYKFLSSTNHESMLVQRLISSMALVRPDIKFRLTVDGKERINSLGNGSLRSVAVQVYGDKIADAMMEFSQQEGEICGVDGLLAPPSLKRRNRNFITLSVNRRLVSNRRMVAVLAASYRDYFEHGEFPIAVINLTVPRTEVDVNIHPAKTDIRFSREDLILPALRRSVRETLQKLAPVPEVRNFEGGALATEATVHTAGYEGEGAVVQPTTGREGIERPIVNHAVETGVRTEETAEAVGSAVPLPTHEEVLSALRFVGQVQLTYLVAETGTGVYLVDQHAASERVTYEQIKASMSKGEVESQQLLVPDVITLPTGAGDVSDKYADELRETGFQFDVFDDGSIVLRAVPAIMTLRRTKSPKLIFSDILDELNGFGGKVGRENAWRERLIATIACHSSVRAGQKMSVESAEQLIQDLGKADHPQTCPHGRPTMLSFSSARLAREFGRT